jgi:hypothetical protein
MAARIADESMDSQGSQDWHRDRVRAAIARTYVILGDMGEADRFEAGLADSEAGRTAAARVGRMTRGEFDARLARVDAVLATGSLDQIRNAKQVCVHLFDRFHDDVEARQKVLQRLRSAAERVPVLVRLEVLMDASDVALRHDDSALGLDLVNEATSLVEHFEARPPERVPVLARLAVLRHRFGEAAAGRALLDAARSHYEANRKLVVDIHRAGTLRPLAEAHARVGDTVTALRLFREAVEEGTANPNSRPRATDLVATCCSMARLGVEPDARLWERLRQINGALGNPW